MICRNCGRTQSSNDRFCAYCGAPLKEDNPASNPTFNPMLKPASVSLKNQNRNLTIALIVVSVVALVVIIGLLIFKGNQPVYQPSAGNDPSAVPVSSETPSSTPDITNLSSPTPTEVSTPTSEPTPEPTPEAKLPEIVIDYENVTYEAYTNRRYGYTIDVPTFLIQQGESDNKDGNSYVSDDGEVILTVWGSKTPAIYEEASTLDGLYKFTRQYLDYEPTFTTKRDNFFVFSGFRDGNIVYEKHVFKSDLTENVFVITYPQEQKEDFDDIVTHIAYSIETGIGTDSPRER